MRDIYMCSTKSTNKMLNIRSYLKNQNQLLCTTSGVLMGGFMGFEPIGRIFYGAP